MLYEKIKEYIPCCEQEENDRRLMLSFMDNCNNYLLRDNTVAHFTASSWIVNKDRTKVLMIYHNIYDSWAWTGGHADGEENLLHTAIKEAVEETGIKHIRPVSENIFSIEVLTVDGHIKRGKYVSSHLHLNVTYLLEADENDELHIKADENKGVAWFDVKTAMDKVSEPWMKKNIYKKLIRKVGELK